MSRAPALLGAVGLALALGACGSPPAASCADALSGLYAAPDGGRWMVLDNRPAAPTLEIYPIFPDAAGVAAPPGIVVAPRVIDLSAGSDGGFGGETLRRYARGGDHCDARAPTHVTACTADGLELVLADPSAPLALAPCTAAAPGPSRRERWTRVAR